MTNRRKPPLRPKVKRVKEEEGWLDDPGPSDPDAQEENSITSLTFNRAELEECVRWVTRERANKRGIPRRVASVLGSLHYLLIKYPDQQEFQMIVRE